MTRGNAAVGLFPDHTPTGDPNFAEINGVVTAVPREVRVFDNRVAYFSSSVHPMHALTIRTDVGREWTLTYNIHRHHPAVDVTPDLSHLLGERVTLRFRVIRGFGSTAGFVLFTPTGVVFALDLAIYGDPLADDDVPGLTVMDGAAFATTGGLCFDHEHHTFTFIGDQAVDVLPGDQGTLSIGGVAFNATTIFNIKPAGDFRGCYDAPGATHAWAVWRQR